MRCENTGCTKKAKVKVSQQSGWIRHWCYAHTAKNIKGLLRSIVKWNSAVYIQKVIEE
jgi:hypothetical protein